MKLWMTLSILLLGLTTLNACSNTLDGAGQDIEKAGQKIQKAF